MRKQIKQAVMLSFLIAAVVGAGACLSPPGEACGGGWCAEGYRCASVDLTAICIKSACGDSIVDVGEECDDGNLADNDDCLQACKLNTCGDGQINLRTEACDDGNDVNGDGCDSNCTVPACGNGAVALGEMCDDGNGNDNDGCDSDCTISLLAYIKASNTGAYDQFGYSVALSADGSTLAVGAWLENSVAKGINGDQTNDGAPDAGAVYVFTRSGMAWSQQAYVKASNTYTVDRFGSSVALSADGSTLAVGAPLEDSAATGINGDQADDRAPASGAVYVFTRSGTTWGQQAYVKASNTGREDQFGWSVALSANGSTLAVGANLEDSVATGTRGNQADNSARDAGAVYVFTRSGTTWSQQAYVKASNTDAGDQFGHSVALSANGTTLAVGAGFEASAATGIGGNQLDDTAFRAGAVYLFTRSGTTWSQQAYVKASKTHAHQYFGGSVTLSDDGSTLAVGAWGQGSAGAAYVFTRSGTPLTWSEQAYLKASNAGTIDHFGYSVALSADGSTLAVGAPLEDSTAIGIGGNQDDNSARDAGAAYVFTRSGTTWSQQAYVKASNTGIDDRFGFSVALSADGSTLAVGAWGEDSAATGIFGDQLNERASEAGAAYVFMELLGL